MNIHSKAEILQKKVIVGKTVCVVVGTVTFAFLTVLGAFIRIPLSFTPVPITAQTFFVFLAGLCLGKRWGAFSQIGYLLLGAGGLAVFAGGGGLLYLAGPTGGYLLGFVACTWIIGSLVASRSLDRLSNRAGFAWILFSVFIGSMALYLLGTFHLMLVAKVSIGKAISLGVFPFIPGYILKMFSASLFFWKFNHRIRQIFPLE